MSKTKKDTLGAVFQKFDRIPYLFIGSGMSRRYLGLPDWRGLLDHFAKQIEPENPLALESIAHGANLRDLPAVATKLESVFNEHWLSQPKWKTRREKYQDLVRSGLSPLKLEVATFIAQSSKRNEKVAQDEMALLKNVAKRSVAGVITTNYDCWVEDIFSGYEVFIGQEELLFANPQGVMEIYKIHGCCTKPGSLVLNAADFERFNQRNAYLAAKLVTVFVEHPIVFLGYSINDPNIRALLEAITTCLTPAHLEQLRRRLVFVEYTTDELTEPRISGHSIDFPNQTGTIEMLRIELDNFLPLYRELQKQRYSYNPKLLRQIKRDIYRLVETNEPVDSFQVVDIEDDEKLDNVGMLVGVGVGGGGEGGGHHIPTAESLFRDVLFDDGGFEIKSLVEHALPAMLKSHSHSLPVHKYIDRYEKSFGETAPISVTADAKNHWECYLSRSLETRKRTRSFSSVEELLQQFQGNDQKIMEHLPLVESDKLAVEQLGKYLREYLERSPQSLTTDNQDQALRTNLKRAIKIYDCLKFGKKKGAPNTSSESVT